jgi:hypothetical protein
MYKLKQYSALKLPLAKTIDLGRKVKLACGTVMAAAADPGMPGVGGQRRLRLRLLVHFS